MLSRGGAAERLSGGNLDSATQPMIQSCAMGWSQARRANLYGLERPFGMPRDGKADRNTILPPRTDFTVSKPQPPAPIASGAPKEELVVKIRHLVPTGTMTACAPFFAIEGVFSRSRKPPPILHSSRNANWRCLGLSRRSAFGRRGVDSSNSERFVGPLTFK